MNFSFSIIGLSETWAKDLNVNLYKLHGYKQECEYRTDRSGGGVAIFIKENLSYKCRDDLNLFIDSTESIFIELSKENTSYSKNVIIQCRAYL